MYDVPNSAASTLTTNILKNFLLRCLYMQIYDSFPKNKNVLLNYSKFFNASGSSTNPALANFS